MSDNAARHLRLKPDGDALVSNWQALNKLSGDKAECGAAVKANGYGLGVTEIVPRLARAGCKHFYVATWQEAAEIEPLKGDAVVTVLNGVLETDMPIALSLLAKPMLNSVAQVERWRPTGLPCDVMIDSGMNRLGLGVQEAAKLDWTGLNVDVLASHLASADEDTPQNADQLAVFNLVVGQIPHRRLSLANSAGIALGSEYSFDLTRPGISLYGGIPRPELKALIKPVGSIESRILQTRSINMGDKVGYNATFIAGASMRIAIISIGYADGYLRGFANTGCFFAGERSLPVIGRVSMDLVALDIDLAPELVEGDWICLPLDLSKLSAQSGLSQYEVITSLGQRYDREWIN